MEAMENRKKSSGEAVSRRYLERCAHILSAGAYRMCRDNYKRLEKGERIDPKLLKETCLAVKETAALVSGLSGERESGEAVKIMFTDTDGCEA